MQAVLLTATNAMNPPHPFPPPLTLPIASHLTLESSPVTKQHSEYNSARTANLSSTTPHTHPLAAFPVNQPSTINLSRCD